jgi:septum formation protein
MAAELTLASRSPQRRAILEQLGVSFRVVEPDVEELGEGDPRAVVVENARRKAFAVGGGPIVLGVDTEVVLDGEVYGKPADAHEARTMLERLSGRWHEVLGGICLRAADGARESCVSTGVLFRALSERDVGWYVAGGEWHERAGGYAIQGRGAALVEAVEGDFWNVVGLPVAELVRLHPALLGD